MTQELVYLGMNFYKVHYNQNDRTEIENPFHEIFFSCSKPYVLG